MTRILRLDSSKEPSATARAAADRGAASATPGTTCAGLNGVGLTDLDPSKLARLQTLWSSRRVLASSSAASLNGSPAKGLFFPRLAGQGVALLSMARWPGGCFAKHGSLASGLIYQGLLVRRLTWLAGWQLIY